MACLAACTGSPRPKQHQHHQKKETGLQQHRSHLAYPKTSMCTEELWPLPGGFVHIWFTLKCQALTQSSSVDDTSHCLQGWQGVQAGRQGRAAGGGAPQPNSPLQARPEGGLNTQHLRVSSHLANTDQMQSQKLTSTVTEKSSIADSKITAMHTQRYFVFTSSVPAVEKNLNTLVTAVQEHAQVCTHLSLSHKEI